MKRELSPMSHRPVRRFGEGHTRRGACMALVDARFLMWLVQQGQSGSGETLQRQGMAGLLGQALEQSGLELDVRRIYWYTDRADGQVVDEQVMRLVASHDQDGGASLVRAMSQDLLRLAEHRACDHVLLATDDERLLGVIDEAQLHGLSVHLLADELARNMPQMLRSDPGWARLLSQADRRVIVSSQSLGDALQGRGASAISLTPEEQQVLRTAMNEVVTAWWEEEPEDLREDLREALQVSRGVPQEVDRQLLHRMRQHLNRTLSLPEKKMLRETLRATVLDQAQAEDAQPAAALD